MEATPVKMERVIWTADDKGQEEVELWGTNVQVPQENNRQATY